MQNCSIRVLPEDRILSAPYGSNLLEILRNAGLHPDAPCGGRGTCGKCTVEVDGVSCLSCRTIVERDMTVKLPQRGSAVILTSGVSVETTADGTCDYALAVDIGTTTVVAY